MISYVLKQNKNPHSVSKGNWFAYPDIKHPVNLSKLAELMCLHNTGFSRGGLLDQQEHPGREVPCPCHRRPDCQEPEPRCLTEEGHRRHKQC